MALLDTLIDNRSSTPNFANLPRVRNCDEAGIPPKYHRIDSIRSYRSDNPRNQKLKSDLNMKRSRMRQIQSIILGRVKIFRQVGSPRSSDSRIILSVQSTEAHFTQFSRIFRQIYMKTPKTIKGHLKSIVLCLNYFSINQKNNSSSSSLEALPCSSLEYLLSLFSLDGKHTLLSYTLT